MSGNPSPDPRHGPPESSTTRLTLAEPLQIEIQVNEARTVRESETH